MSCLIIGLFYVFTTYAGDVFYGPDKYVNFGALDGGSPWIQLAREVWGIGWVVAFFAILNSTFANGNAGTLATTRTWFAMSRIGLLPSPLARLHPRYRSPWVGVLVQLVVTLAIGLPVALHFGPTTAFVFLATILTGIMIAIYMIFNLSCIMYYLRRRRQEFNVLLHLVIPVLGIAGVHPGVPHRARHRALVPEVRYPAQLPIQRGWAGHRHLVRDRRRRADLPVRQASGPAAGDEAGLRRRDVAGRRARGPVKP